MTLQYCWKSNDNSTPIFQCMSEEKIETERNKIIKRERNYIENIKTKLVNILSCIKGLAGPRCRN